MVFFLGDMNIDGIVEILDSFSFKENEANESLDELRFGFVIVNPDTWEKAMEK